MYLNACQFKHILSNGRVVDLTCKPPVNSYRIDEDWRVRWTAMFGTVPAPQAADGRANNFYHGPRVTELRNG